MRSQLWRWIPIAPLPCGQRCRTYRTYWFTSGAVNKRDSKAIRQGVPRRRLIFNAVGFPRDFTAFVFVSQSVAPALALTFPTGPSALQKELW